MKTCIVCHESKPEDAYYLNRKTGKRVGRCKACAILANLKIKQQRQELRGDSVVANDDPIYAKVGRGKSVKTHKSRAAMRTIKRPVLDWGK